MGWNLVLNAFLKTETFVKLFSMHDFFRYISRKLCLNFGCYSNAQWFDNLIFIMTFILLSWFSSYFFMHVSIRIFIFCMICTSPISPLCFYSFFGSFFIFSASTKSMIININLHDLSAVQLNKHFIIVRLNWYLFLIEAINLMWCDQSSSRLSCCLFFFS